MPTPGGGPQGWGSSAPAEAPDLDIMPLQIVPLREEHLDDAARICFDAFGSLHDRHAVPRDLPSAEFVRDAFAGLASRPDFLTFAALDGGRVVGSNFLQISDCAAGGVAGVGPITVDPRAQSRGVGRVLMQAVLDAARERAIAQVRLFQESINAASLSLYTRLGFDWRDSVAIMSLAPADADDPTIAPMTEADLPEVDRLSRAHYRNPRSAETAVGLAGGFPAFVRRREGRVVGYFLPSIFGQGAAESRDDLVALLRHAPRHAPEFFHRALVPLSQPALFRDLLEAGCRVQKTMTYMTIGPFDPPREAWIPSIGC